MRARIHRGTREIGGSCVELAAADGSRLVLDLGRPLDAGWDESVALPAVAGLRESDPTLHGIVISHPHLDHYGLLAELRRPVPVYIGAEAASVLAAASFFSPVSAEIVPAGSLRHGAPVEIGSFVVTPLLNDHSAFDAYSLVIDADGRRLFYTGDIRAHGRKASLFERLVAEPPRGVDVLLMEGTHVRPDGAEDELEYPTETMLEDRFVEEIGSTRGAVVVVGSAQNLDRLVTVYRAAKRAGRTLVVDLYGATVAQAARPSIPQPGFDALRVYVPRRQRVRVKESGQFDRVHAVAPHRVFPEELAESPGRFVFHVPSSAVPELITQGVLDRIGALVWSLWSGYLADSSGAALRNLIDEHHVPMTTIHTSGHASVPDLRRLVTAIQPRRVVPIHSFAAHRFAELFPCVEEHSDGEWWDV